MKKIICFIGAMNAGGAETFLMKIYRALNREKYLIDFALSTQEQGYYDKEIRQLGGRIYRLPGKTKHPLANVLSSYKILREEHYDAAFRMASHSLGTIDLLVAKAAGVERLVLRSTNAGTTGGMVSLCADRFFSFLPRLFPDVKIAPSKWAAEYVFGRGCIERGEAHILNNAVPLEEFLFNPELRSAKRAELGIGDELLIGHVGRFNEQKNHEYLLHVFAELLKKVPDARLVLVGKGDLEQSIRKQAELLGISGRLIFTGVRSDIPQLMMAFDAMIFPSLFEGLPNVIVEAQATGLPCVLSDQITPEVVINSDIIRLPLDNNYENWVGETLSLVRDESDRRNQSRLYQAGYDMGDVTENFIKLVFGSSKGESE